MEKQMPTSFCFVLLSLYALYHIQARLSIAFIQFVQFAVFLRCFQYVLYKYYIALYFVFISRLLFCLLFVLYTLRFAPYGVLNAS